MGRTGRAAVMVGERFEMREYEVPEPEPGSILLRQEMAGICGTDLHNWEHQGLEGEILLGHENVGIIEQLGDGVETDYFGQTLKEGDRVVFFPRTPGGIYGFMDADGPPAFTGGFADYMYLFHPESVVYKVNMPPEVAVITEPFNIGVHGVMRSGLKFGDTAVIQGSGAIGLVTLICARVSGAGRLIIVGGPPGRLELAKKMGADVTIDIGEVSDLEERTRLVLEETQRGEGADVVFECAGFLPAINEGLGYVRYGGTYVEMGHFVDIGTFEFNPNQMLMRKNLRLEAIWGGRAEYFARAIPILEKNEFPYAEMVSHVLPLERIAEGFNALASGYRMENKDAVKIALRGNLV